MDALFTTPPMEVFRANTNKMQTKRFIKSQLAGAEQLAIFKVQPKIEPWANENKSREYQDKRLERRNTKLQIQHPNYSVTLLLTSQRINMDYKTKNLKNSPKNIDLPLFLRTPCCSSLDTFRR